MRPSRAGTTVAAAIFHFATVLLAGAFVLVFLVLAWLFAGLDSSGRVAGEMAALAALLMIAYLLFAAAATWLGVQLLRRRPWARWLLVAFYVALTTGEAVMLVQDVAAGGGSALLGPQWFVPPAALFFLLHPHTANDVRRTSPLTS